MAELPKPTATRREEPSRGDSRLGVRASAGGPRPERRVCEAPTGSAENDELPLIPDDRGAVDDALPARGSVAEAAPDRAARQFVLALVSQVSALPAPHLAGRTRGVR
jgi:hypothetical protein